MGWTASSGPPARSSGAAGWHSPAGAALALVALHGRRPCGQAGVALHVLHMPRHPLHCLPLPLYTCFAPFSD